MSSKIIHYELIRSNAWMRVTDFEEILGKLEREDAMPSFFTGGMLDKRGRIKEEFLGSHDEVLFRKGFPICGEDFSGTFFHEFFCPLIVPMIRASVLGLYVWESGWMDFVDVSDGKKTTVSMADLKINGMFMGAIEQAIAKKAARS